MASTINTNIQSLISQRHLSNVQNEQSTAMSRLSSGLRVNSAKDDAAGLAIAERMNAQVKGMTVAVRNANDGISLAQTAEGALGQVGDILQRMRELAVQSANDSNSQSDRNSMNLEYQALSDEIVRSFKATTFNGQKILEANAGTLTFQVGANKEFDNQITISTQNMLNNVGILAITGNDVMGRPAGVAVTEPEVLLNPESKIDGTQDINGVEIVVGTVLSNGDLTRTTTNAAGDISVETRADLDPATVWVADAANSRLHTVTVLEKLDNAINSINSERAMLGATQSRFETATQFLQISSENQSAAKSRIMDADFAVESANLSRSQILSQAASSMLAQANQMPQSVLSLIQG